MEEQVSIVPTSSHVYQLPNQHYVSHCLSVYTDDKPTSNESLTNTSISQIGSTVRVECHEDDNDEKNTSYVLVYRAYGNQTLSVTTYNKTISFNITTLETGNYTFAIFRRNDSDIDKEPLITQLIVVGQTGTDPPLSSSSPTLSSGKY